MRYRHSCHSSLVAVCCGGWPRIFGVSKNKSRILTIFHMGWGLARHHFREWHHFWQLTLCTSLQDRESQSRLRDGAVWATVHVIVVKSLGIVLGTEIWTMVLTSSM